MEKLKTGTARKVFAYYRDFARSNKWYAFGAYGLFAAAFACTEILRPYIVKYVIDGTINHTVTPVMAMILFGIAAFLYNVFFRGADYTIVAFESRMWKILYDGSIRKILDHSPLFFINHSDTGKLITRIRRFVLSFEVLFEEFTFRVSIMAIYAIGVTCMALATDYRLGLLLVAFIVIFSIVIVAFFGRKMELEQLATERESAVSGGIADMMMNVQTIKHYGRKAEEIERFGKKTSAYKEAEYKAQIFASQVRIIKGSLVMIFDTAMVGLLCYLYNQHTITVGTMYLFFSYSFQISMAIWSMDEGLKKITKAIADASELVDIFDHPNDLPEAPNSVRTINNADITLQDISFAYNGTKQIFSNLSLYIPAGQKIGICGTTGSGKTTLANLILRTMDPVSGKILVDNYSIKDHFSQDGLKNWISYVPQNIDMFSRTVMENIRFADPLASEEAVMSAAKRARLHDFILSLPKGYDTLIGEKGLKLSGGQRQRIGIARALLRNTPILILDEATSALDVMTESEILDILDKEFIGKTVIVIAHRLSTIRDLDRILVLEQGAVVEDGNHYQLLDLQGKYYDFIQAQNNDGGHSSLKEQNLVV
jgi:ATP-binding cassette subfamily B protein